MMRAWRVASLSFVTCLGACQLLSVSPTQSTPREKDYGRPLAPGELALEKVTDPSQYPDFGRGFGEKESLIRAIDGTIEYFGKPSSKEFFPYLDITHERALASLHAFKQVLLEAASPEELNRRIAEGFDVYRSKGWDGSGIVLFTGYCQPIYEGSLEPTDEFRYPLYRLPPELVKDRYGKPLGWDTGSGPGPSPARADFDAGLLAGRGLELVYLRSPLDVYVVHVQGSAKIVLPDGSELGVGYAGKTERPYRGVGQALVQDGKVSKNRLSLAAVKQYFAEHPEELQHYLQNNESYVFFTEREGGPYGSMNIPVTPYRTLATDKAVFPRGGVTFAETAVPTAGGATQPFHQFLLDQDTGGAIQSAGRADIFVGTGPDAERIAGGTYAEGYLWYVYVK